MKKPPPDKCFVSISNTPEGYLLRDHRLPEGQTDRLLTQEEMNGYPVSLGDIVCPEGWQDALKLSNVSNIVVAAGVIAGGSEDVVDMNRCHDVAVYIGQAQPRGKYVATIKGGSTNCLVHVFDQYGNGTETDYDLGNWSDQSQEKTIGTILLLTKKDGVVRVRGINSDKPQIHVYGGAKLKWNGWLRGWFPIVQKIGKKLGVL